MARKPSKTKQDQDAAQQPVDPEQVEASEAETQTGAVDGEQSEPESTTQQAAEPQSETTGSEEQEGKPAARTKARMVEATLKTRHCRGGICKEAGDTMSMTQDEYDRLKKFDRVE